MSEFSSPLLHLPPNPLFKSEIRLSVQAGGGCGEATPANFLFPLGASLTPNPVFPGTLPTPPLGPLALDLSILLDPTTLWGEADSWNA